jgi:hypothetical protein
MGDRMNLEIWMLGLALPALVGGTWMLARWWYLRRIRAVQNKLFSLDGTHQATLRLMTQTRKQIEDLKAVTTEYRRRLTTAELARRTPAVTVAPVPAEAEAKEEASSTRRGPVVWADTQPL